MSDNRPKLTPLNHLARHLIRHADGEPLSVIRPANPKLALALATVCVQQQDAGLFQRLPSEVGDYTIQGWLGVNGKILDRDGRTIGELEPGDSFVTLVEDPEEPS